ncbi:MAG: hypothetical protein IJM24_08795 [Clostridia bacterium]|nr:hypothetical protein [Clostridia bacterium]MBR7061822.1 hypothetical protein [Clostridia bacterium]
MSFLSKLFGGDKDAEKTARDLLKGLFGENAKKDDKPEEKPEEPAQENNTSAPADNGSDAASSGPSGDSWGDDMPAEENQYNYNGHFTAYFENIFNTEFAAYRYEKAVLYEDRRIVYYFYSGDAKVLAVELMTDKSDARKFRNDCRKAGLAYVRFYFNHPGWWNTRSYVVRRIKEALN